MKCLLLNLAFATTLITAASLHADDADLLAGRWSVTKTNEDGQKSTQTIEIKKGKFVFQVLGAKDSVVLYAEGDLKLEKLEPFKVARFFHIRGGDSASNLDDVDDQYVSIYALDGDTWTLASNLDKEREQKPSLDVYHRVKTTADAKERLPSLPEGKKWTLVWHDEFDGPTLDESKWNRLGDSKRRDGYWVQADAYLSGKGTLLLRTRKDGDHYTSGAINTQGKFEHAFGYYVARCQMPKQPGHWPAFWMMCPGVTQVGEDGRDGTEIDIVEIPWRDGKVTMNLHWDGYGKDHKSAGTSTTIPALVEGFHDYGLLWTKEQYAFYVDGQEVWHTSAGGVSQVPEYLKLTEEIGKWAGDISQSALPDYFEVDYVRVYEVSE